MSLARSSPSYGTQPYPTALLDIYRSIRLKREQAAQCRASNVSVDGRSFGEIAVVDFLKLAIHLRGKDALMSESLKCKTESTKTCKKIDEPHCQHPSEGWTLEISLFIGLYSPRQPYPSRRLCLALVVGENLVELLPDCHPLKCGMSLEPPPKMLINTADVGRSSGGTFRNH